MKIIRKLLHDIGHRGGFLLFLTVITLAYGWTFYQSPKLGFDLFLPIHDWSYVWFATGIVTFIGAFLKRGDRYAFGFATTIMMAFSFEWFNLWIRHVPHVPYAGLTGTIWAVFAMTVFLISTWPELSRTRFREVEPPSPEMLHRENDDT